MDCLVRQHDEGVGRALIASPIASGRQVVERPTDVGIEVREVCTRERDAEGVAAGPGEGVAVVAADPHRAPRDARCLRREARFGSCPGLGRERRPRRSAIAVRREGDDRRSDDRANEPAEPPAAPLGALGRWEEADAVLVLDELAEAEIGVLGAGWDARGTLSRRLPSAADDELDLRREEYGDRDPHGDPRAHVVAEEPGDDEDDRGRPDGGLEGRAIDTRPHGRRVGGALPPAPERPRVHRHGSVRVARVPATLMDGKALAERIRRRVAGEVAELGHVGLATVLVGDDPASEVYIRLKQRAAAEAGIDARDIRLDASASESDVLDLVHELNADDGVDGLLVQLPLPSHIDETRVTYAVAPHKDVDGFHPVNAGNLYLGTPLHVPATPAGCMALLGEYGVDPKGKDAVVIGRSEIVGRPAAMLLLQAHATVTICHSRTHDLGAEVARGDIVVAAVGVPGIVTTDMVKPGAAVVDVGLTRGEDGTIRGDVDPAVAEVAALLTPMPGGTGPMTIALLLESAVKAARYRRGLLAYPTL